MKSFKEKNDVFDFVNADKDVFKKITKTESKKKKRKTFKEFINKK